AVGQTQQFTAAGFDQYGNPYAMSPGWSVSGGGSINSNGLFSAASAGGPFTVLASDDGVSGSAEVNVLPDSGWATLPSSNHPRHESSLVAFGTKLILMGGRGARPVEIFDLETNQWSTRSSPPLELHHFQATVVDGLVYIIGAYTGSWPFEDAVDHVYTYDPILDQWSVGPLIPAERRRGSAAAVVHQNQIYVAGGIVGGHGEHAEAKRWLDKFDPATGSWTVLPDMPTARDHFGAAIVAGKIYAVAGRDSGASDGVDVTVSQTDVYDINASSWGTLPSSSNIPTARSGVGVTSSGDLVIVIGGEGQGQAWDSVEALDTTSGNWQTLPAIPTARHGMGAATINGSVYVAAGSQSQGGGPETGALEALFIGD
ncbi:MAG: hypothetical protein HKM98_04725, partial [Gammaproteobacteria bacterium]|nr:hypothetical protein [Gammaproteobacteria bacterium]